MSTIQFLSTYLERVFEIFVPVIITLFVYFQIERTESGRSVVTESPRYQKSKQLLPKTS